jgi:TolB-like protein
MKKAMVGIFSLFTFIMGCAGGAKPVVNSGDLTLDQAIWEASIRIDERLAAGTKIAPLNFNSPTDKFSGYVLDDLTANLVDSGKLTVVDRNEVDLIRSEFDFQLSGEVGNDSMQELGRMLGAQSIISGSLTDMGGFYRIVIRVLNVESAAVEVQHRANIVNDTIVAALLTGGKSRGRAVPPRQVSGSGPAPAARAQAVPAKPPAAAYNIGDTGPAGGIVFYDKGNNSGGWRYLEIAPVETERTAPIYLTDRNGVVGNRRVGEGKENTRKFVVQFQREGGGINSAAWLCNELTVNGFDDWYLPSLDEVLYIYNNLYLRGLADLKPDRYWTSFVGYANDIWERIFYVDFADGSEKNFDMIWNLPAARCQVRAVRQF